jgi:hypothetical protein
MKEYQIVLDMEIDVSENKVAEITEAVKDFISKSKHSNFISDIYWDEI